jgi:hypothetical protein
MRNTHGPAAAVGMWVSADRRRRWKSLTVLALLGAVSAGLAFAFLAGARRTNTAFARLRTDTNAADATVFASQVGAFHPDWSKLAARPEVAQLTPWYLLFGQIPGDPQEAVLFGSVGEAWGTQTDKPVVIHGRMYNPRATDEMVVDEETAKHEHVQLGQTFDFHAYAPGQDDTSGAPPAGAKFPLHVVGIVRTTQEFLFTPLSMLSPGVLTAHRSDMLWIENAFVHLRPGAGGVGALQRDANQLIAPGTPVFDLHTAERRVDTTLNVEKSALLLLAIAIAAAALVLIGQVLGRSASAVADDAEPLRAVGMVRSDLASAGARSHLYVAMGAGAGSIVVAVIASRWFPVGLGARVDPHPGFHADWLVLIPGALAVGGLIVLGAYGIARRAVRRRSTAQTHAGAVVGWVRQNGPVSAGVGATMMFDRNGRRADAAVRPAIIGAIVGVLGVVGAFTIDHGLHEALANPARAGVTWDATVAPVTGEYAVPRGVQPDLIAATAAVPGVRTIAEADRVVIGVNGVGVPGFTIRETTGAAFEPIRFTVLSGRAPSGTNEIAIGPATAHDLHVSVSDTAAVGDVHRPMKIVGTALFPSDVHATFDEGVWLSPPAWAAVVPPNTKNQENGPQVQSVLAVRFQRGTDVNAEVNRLTSALGKRAEEVDGPNVPIELANLRNVERLPEVLALVLALLGIAALTYLLVALARSRARDFAVLRALGFTRGQSRAVVGSESTAICLLGLLIGVPLGMIAGTTAWRLIADRVPLQNVPPVAALALVVIVPAALVVGALVAVWPAHRVVRLRPAEILRSE